ncbi:hypothetical protein LTR86_004061 [Recurvomyces mirabilis]|nr:hypothetical protein LTR86_004061 [Recurvomyces mirabilis]
MQSIATFLYFLQCLPSIVAQSEYLATVNIGITVPPLSSYSNSTQDGIQSATASLSSVISRINGTNTTLDAGHLAASICNQQRISYSLASEAWQTMVAPTTNCSTSTNTYGITQEDHAINIEWTTFCDGHPRTPYNFTYSLTTKMTTLQVPVCGRSTRLNSGLYPSSYPSCTIQPSECNKLYQDNLDAAVATIYTPLCSTVRSFKPSCGACTVFANGMQLFYWPTTTTSGDLCQGNGTTITAAPTGQGPNTMVVGNSTYISPSAYYSFSDLFATAANGAMCGTAQAHFEVPVWTFDLSSISYSPVNPAQTQFDAYTQSMNLADLNYPVPWSAYRGQMLCANNMSACATISSPYMPELAIPIWLTEVQEQWTTCSVLANVYDPPQALSQVAQVQLPTIPASPTSATATVSATPGSGVIPTQPLSTTSSSQSLYSNTAIVAGVPEGGTNEASSLAKETQSLLVSTVPSAKPTTRPVNTIVSNVSGAGSTVGTSGIAVNSADPSVLDAGVVAGGSSIPIDGTAPSISHSTMNAVQVTSLARGSIDDPVSPAVAATTMSLVEVHSNPAASGVASAILQMFSDPSRVQPAAKETAGGAVTVLISALSSQKSSQSSDILSDGSSPSTSASGLSDMDPVRASTTESVAILPDSDGIASPLNSPTQSRPVLPSVALPSILSVSGTLSSAALESQSTTTSLSGLRSSLTLISPNSLTTSTTFQGNPAPAVTGVSTAAPGSASRAASTLAASPASTIVSSRGSSGVRRWDSKLAAYLIVLTGLLTFQY